MISDKTLNSYLHLHENTETKGSKMAKLTAQKIFEIEQEVNKLDTSRFSVVSEVQLIDRALEMHKAAKKFEAQEEIDMAYKCYFLFVSMATYIFKKTKDELYVKEMLTKPTVESMNKLEKMKDDSIKLEKNKDNIKNEEKENRKSPVKSSQSKDLGVKTKKSSASGADIKSNAKNGVHEAGINSMDKYIIKPEDKYEPATPSISSSELHKILNNRNVLLIDCRPQQEYNSCTLKTSAENLINVPEEINVKGLSAKTLGDKLMAEHQTLWSIRNTFDHIILFDQYSKVKPNGKDSSLERLLLIINEYDVNTKYKTAPVLLEGGFNAWFCHFPFLTTNSANYKQSLHDMGYKLPSQTNINDITYHLDSTSPEPDLPGDDEGSTPVPAPTTTPQPVPETKNINPADTPLVRPKPPPQVDRSNKPFENSNPVPPSQRKPSRTSEQDNQPVKRPDRLLSNGKVADSRVERPRFDGGESLRPFGSKLTRSSSHPNLSQLLATSPW
ncbi:hypothetical protein M8J75_005649 [Diaphorina citri]|nr:hypothetical protein M8J75_005649 [Diaphorina citri]